MNLTATTDSLELVLSGAITTTALDWVSWFADETIALSNVTAFQTGRATGTSNNTSNVTIVPAPSANHQRQIKFVSVFNNDTAAATVKINYNDNGTRRRVYQATLQPSTTLTYTDGDGWRVWDTNGALLTSASSGVVLQASLTLTDAQIKTLPTVLQTLVPAPGAGLMIVPIAGFITARCSAGAYTNIDVAAWLTINYNSGANGLGYLVNDAAITNGDVGATALTNFLAASNQTAAFTPFTATENLDEWGPVPVAELITAKENQSLDVKLDNQGTGNLTGGNAANTLHVWVLYTVQSV